MSSYQNSSGNQPTKGNEAVKVSKYERSAEQYVDGEPKKIYEKSLAKNKVKGKK